MTEVRKRAQRARMRAEMQEGHSAVFGSARLTPRPSCANCLGENGERHHER